MGSQEGVNCIHLLKVNWKGFTRIVMFTSQDLKKYSNAHFENQSGG